MFCHRLRVVSTMSLALILTLSAPIHCELSSGPLSSASSSSSSASSLPVVPNIEEKFKITRNSIIRTHDSRAAGAKYLNETELSSNRDCLLWCWNTPNCNLAVFEEKIKGSCYLFDCGPATDFKCRFTPHSFYSSSLLEASRSSALLNEWKNQSNQEKELANLLNVKDSSSKTSISRSVGSASVAVDTPHDPVTPTTAKVSKCRHYQFECANSSECIAIYNVCDGIPQCSDGSDEAHELECHKSRLIPSRGRPTSGGKTTHDESNGGGQAVMAPGQTTPITPISVASAPSSSQFQLFDALKTQPDTFHHELSALSGADKHSGGGGGASNAAPFLSFNYPHSSNGGGGGGSVIDESATNNANWINRQNVVPAEYSNNFVPSSWNSMNGAEKSQIAQLPQQPPQPQMPSGNLVFSNEANQILSENALKDSLYWPTFAHPMSGENTPNILVRTGSGPQSPTFQQLPVASGYNSQLNERQTELMNELRSSRFGALLKPPPAPHSEGVPKNAQTVGGMPDRSVDSGVESTTQKSTTASPVVAKITTQTSNSDHKAGEYSNIVANSHHVKLSPIVAVTRMHDSNAQNGRETNSAVIALTLGLFITGVLIFLVGCRMKSFKKRVARRGRSLAHDADYLINGMYL